MLCAFKAGLHQQDVADRAGIVQQQVSKIDVPTGNRRGR